MTNHDLKQPVILFVLDIFNYGGISTLIRQYIKSLKKDRVKIIIIGSKSNIPDPNKYFSGSHIIYATNKRRWDFFGHITWAYKLYKSFANINHNYHVEYIHISSFHSALFTCLFPPFWKKRKIYTFCGDYLYEQISTFPKNYTISRKRKLALKIMQDFIFFSSSKIITISQYAKKLIQTNYNHFKKDIIIINPYLEKPKQKLVQNRKFNRLKILAISRLEPRKGICELLEALAILKQQNIKFTAKIATSFEGNFVLSTLNIYEKLNLFENVQVIHKVDEGQKRKLFNEANLFVMPSQDLETFGIILIEAIRSGLPSIGTPAGAIPEILKLVDKRLICKTITAKSISEKIIWYNKLSLKEKRKLAKTIQHKSELIFQEDVIHNQIVNEFVYAKN